jgi:peptide/nickel transport system substrate-binding protein
MRRLLGALLLAGSLAVGGQAFAHDQELITTLNSDVKSLLPARATTGEEYDVAVLVYNGLVRINEDLKLEPDLATSWQANDDATEWTFKLRKGVKFHHGKEFRPKT